jgi:uncharacterized protein (DUF1684 family)
MAATPTYKAPSAPPADAFVAEWERWHNERLDALRAVDGAPTLAATFWLSSTNVVPGVDGTWTDSDNGVELSLCSPIGRRARGPSRPAGSC